MKRLTFLVLALLLLGGGASVWANDPCADSTVNKVSVPVAVSTATTTKLVDVPANSKSTALCGCDFTVAGTTPTVKFEYGTHGSADCDTGTTALSGAFAPTAGTSMYIGGSYTAAWAPAGNQLCLVSTGTGASVQGVCTYAAY